MDKRVSIPLAIIMFFSFITLLILILMNNCMPFELDISIQNIALDIRNDTLTTIFKGITFLSDPIVIIVIILTLTIIPKTRFKYGLPVAITEVSALGIYALIKILVARPRPDASLWLVQETDFSFPSGHTITSFVVYGLLIFLIDRSMKEGKKKKIFMIVAFLLLAIIPFTRIYLCVHWPTDILGGWLFGAGVLLVSATLITWIYERKNNKLEINNKNIK